MSTPQLYTDVVIVRDLPEKSLYHGDIATYIEHLPHPDQGEDGAILEVANIFGETLRLVTVPISAIAPLRPDHVPMVRLVDTAPSSS